MWRLSASGLASAIDGPARQAFVSELVGQDNISNAVALNSASFTLARLTGPAIAGVLIAWVGTGPVFLLLNAASFAAVIISLLRIRSVGSDSRPRRPCDGKHPGCRGPSDACASRRPDLVLILVMVGHPGSVWHEFRRYERADVHRGIRDGAGRVGLLGSIMAVGTLAGALLAARRSGPRLRFLLGGALGSGVLHARGQRVPSFWLYAAVLVPVGLAANDLPEQLQYEYPALGGAAIPGACAGAVSGRPAGRDRSRGASDGMDRY